MTSRDGIRELEENLGVRFENRDLLEQALTHSSYIREKDSWNYDCNERLEFLGDAFFDAIIGEEIYKEMEDKPEGTLSKCRALIVCEDGLYQVAKDLNLGKYLNLGKGEIRSGGDKKVSILADAMEAVIGALYLDKGYDVTKEAVLRIFAHRIKDVLDGKIMSDYKSTLQESLQQSGKVVIKYKIDKEEGPDHDKIFFVSLIVNGEAVSQGKGKSKKEAEQDAAKVALAGRK